MSDRNVMAKLVCCFVRITSFINLNLAVIDKMFKTFYVAQILNWEQLFVGLL
jgi:hypothetical protein